MKPFYCYFQVFDPSILVLAQVNVQVWVPKEHRPVTSDQALQVRKRK